MTKALIKRILHYVKPYAGFLIAALACGILSIGLTLAGPILIGDGVDLIIGPREVDFAGLAKIRSPISTATRTAT